MRAFLNDGKGLGSEHSTVTKEYKTLKTLIKYAVKPFLKKHNYCRVELFNNWDNRYGKPDKILVFVNYPMKCDQCSYARLNGTFVHEFGCPNDKKKWDYDIGAWIKPENDN